MLIDIIYLVIGLFLLVVCGHFLVKAGSGAAKKFNIAPFIIGATVVAFGTSAPELLVSINAAVSGHPEIALGNVIGSNIANIALVLGITACLITLPIISKRLFTDWALVMISSILLIAFASNGVIALWEGLILVAILVAYIYSAIKSPKVEADEEPIKPLGWGMIIILFLASCAGLAGGAHLLVTGASNIARMLDMSERVISITIVAFGTSLPELATSVVAALRKQTDISIGNIIGSNLFNILAVVGITSIVKPIHINFADFQQDLFLMLFTALALMLLIYPYRKNFKSFKQSRKLNTLAQLDSGKLSIIGGIILLAAYLAYIFTLLA